MRQRGGVGQGPGVRRWRQRGEGQGGWRVRHRWGL